MPATVQNPTIITTTSLIALNQKARGLSLHSNLVRSPSDRRAGRYQSMFKGRGMEYDESRLYQAGDDIRNIDWRVTARTGKTHTKLFREERRRPVYLWVDFRAPMFFATHGKYKAVIAAELASLFAWTAVHQGDRTGGIIFSDVGHRELKPQQGQSSALKLIKCMVDEPAWQQPAQYAKTEQQLLQPLLRLRRLARAGSLIILLSDFRGFNDEIRAQLFYLCQHNELLLVHIYDRLEASLPPAGRYKITDDQQAFVLDTTNPQRADNYHKNFAQHQAMLRNMARLNNLNYLSCRTEDNPEKIIRQGLGFK